MNEAPEFYDETWRTARKGHGCVECGGAIPIGRRYMRINGKWSGEVQTFRMHATCYQIVQHLHAFIKHQCDPYAELPAIGDLVEYADEDAREGDDFPSYWPAGIYISKAALRQHVEQVEK